METVNVGWALGAALILLAVSAAAIVRVAGLGRARDPLIAAARACAQLAAVSLIITAVLEALWSTALFLGVMLTIATITSSRRITGSLGRHSFFLAIPVAIGPLFALTLVLLTGAVPIEPIAILPTAGILIGNAMSVTSVSGKRVTEELVEQRGQYEGALAVGLTRREAVGVVGRPAAAVSLIPDLDKTRTVGLVTLPGAFVGVLLGGASATQAGAAQALVLIALLAVQAIAAALVVELVAAGRLPVDGASLPE